MPRKQKRAQFTISLILFFVIPILVSTSQANADGPVAYYRLDETAGAVVEDASGNGNTGTAVNGVVMNQAGKVGTAFSFDGVNDYVSVPHSSSLNITGTALTLDAWVYPRSGTGQQIFVNKEYAYEMGIINGKFQFAFMSSGAWKGWYGNTALILNQWQHVAVSYDGAAVRFYVDGLLREVVAVSGGIDASTQPLGIGARIWTGSWTGFFNGQLDEVKVWNRVLTYDEVWIEAGRSGPIGQAAYYRLDEVSGTVVADASDNGNTGTAVNGVVMNQAGKVGTAFSLDGVNDYVRVPHSASLNITGTALTLDAWVYPRSGTGQQIFVNKEYAYEMGIINGKFQFAFMSSGAWKGWYGNTALTLNQWQHVAVSYDGAVVSFYVDGVLRETVAASGGINASTQPLGIGARIWTGSWTGFFNGQLDEVKVWNRVLSDADVAQETQGTLTLMAVSLPMGTVGQGYSATLSVTGGTPPYSWSVTGGSLPSGLSLTPATGVISGTPTTAGASNFTVIVTDATGASVSKDLSITVNASPVITTTSLPNGVEGSAYSAALQATGGTAPLTWSIIWGALPSGLILSGSTIFGTPTVAGTSSFIVEVRDANGANNSQSLTITIDLAPLAIATSSLPNGTLENSYSATLSASGGVSPYTWTITTGSLPPGLSLNSMSGVISGNPTSSGIFNFTIQVMDGQGSISQKDLSIVISSGLAVYYRLDEVSGTVVADASGNGNTGTAVNGVVMNQAGKVGTAFSFDGVNDYVSVPQSSSLNITGTSLTLQAWVYPRSGTGQQIFVNKEYAYGMGNIDGKFQFAIMSGGVWKGWYGSIALTLNQWQHVAVSYDGAAVRFYVDGVLRETVAASGGIDASTQPLGIGARIWTGSWTSFFNGQLDEVKVLNRVLTYDEVWAEAGRSGPIGQAAYYHLDEVSGTVVGDASGNSNTGTAVNGVVMNQAGKVGTAFSFDGVNDYVSVPQSSSLNITGTALTLEAWVYPRSGTGQQIFVNKEYAYEMGIINGKFQFAFMSSGAWKGWYGNTALILNQWQHVAVSYDGAAVRFYVDGLLREVVAVSGGIDASTQPLGIGARIWTGSWTGFFNGQLDEVKVLNRVLSDAEIVQETQVPLTPTTVSLPMGTVGQGYSATLSVTGGTPPYSWSVTGGSLPSGLSLPPATGVISGTPTTAGASNFTVIVTDATGASVSKDLSITVNASPVITTTSLPNGVEGSAYSAALQATGGTAPLTWSIIWGALPSGLILSGSTIFGTPTVAGTSSFIVEVRDANGASSSRSLTITIDLAPLTIATSSLPDGTLENSYSATLSASGGLSPYTWTIMAGSLPPGLTLTPSSGAISGSPTAGGNYTFTVLVSDTASATATQSFTIGIGVTPTRIEEDDPAVLYEGSWQHFADANASKGKYKNSSDNTASLNFTFSGTSVSWISDIWSDLGIANVYIDGMLDATVDLYSATGKYQQTVYTKSGLSGGNHTIKIEVTGTKNLNSAGTLVDLDAFEIIPSKALTILTPTLPDGTINRPYMAGLTASDGTPPLTWSINSGSLPAGLALDGATGSISGTPMSVGTTSFTVQVTDATGATSSRALSLRINPSPVITTTSLPNGSIGVFYSVTLTVNGGTTPYTWTVSSGSLPAGLLLNGATITGTPTAIGPSTFTIQVTDAYGAVTSQNLSLTIDETPLGISTYLLPNGTVGSAYRVVLSVNGGTPGYSWSLTSGTLPAGLSLSSTGILTGTPSSSGTKSFTIQVMDSTGRVASNAFSITVNSSGTWATGMEGYASLTSVTQGKSIDFHISTGAATYDLNIYREGPSRTFITAIQGLAGRSYAIPSNGFEAGYAWPIAYTLTIPSNWQSGIYIAEAVSGNLKTEVIFVVKEANPGRTSKILLKLAVNTYQAYNDAGGKSLYDGSFSTNNQRAYKVSFERPYHSTKDRNCSIYACYGNYFDEHELMFVRWIESNGYVIEYATDVDLHADPGLIWNYRLMLSVGHDEYWSKEMRDQVESFVDAGGNVAFLSGNVSWWQVRYENNNRVMVCYKNYQIDPLYGVDNSRVTDYWFPYPVNRPENVMTGLSFRYGGYPYPGGYTSYNSNHWVFQSTGLSNGKVFGSIEEIVGYEVDGAQFNLDEYGIPWVTGNDGTPLQFTILGLATAVDPFDYKTQRNATMGIFTKNGGGTVFNAASVDWAFGLSTNYETHQITKNVIDKLSQPVDPFPRIITESLRSGAVNQSYKSPVIAGGGLFPYSWALQSGNLPPGLSLDPSTGEITGTPTSSGSYSFTIQVRDANSLTDSKSLSININAVTIRYEETNSAISYVGAWQNMSNSSASGGNYKNSIDASTPASATLTFTGTQVKWISDVWNDLGIAYVYIDGVLAATVDLYSATGKYQQVVYSKSDLTPGTHTLRIEVTGTKNPASSGIYIDIDAFEVLN